MKQNLANSNCEEPSAFTGAIRLNDCMEAANDNPLPGDRPSKQWLTMLIFLAMAAVSFLAAAAFGAR